MRRGGAWARLTRAGAALVLASILTLIASPPAGAESGYEQIDGSGSSWAALAVQQWISDESSSMQVVYTPSGSAQGRIDFANGQNDFAISDIGYQGDNEQTGTDDTSTRPYAYLPIVGGATAFPYNIVVAGRRVENLRLSGLTLAKIFTDQITNWDDPEITADNNGHALPSIPIIPVVHSEGAGTTYQFSDFLNTEYPQLWHAFSGYSFPVEFWPTGQGSQVAENGSDGVMGFVASAAGQGSIGYDEYAYAIGAQFPVVALENKAGYFTMPDAYDAAVSLTQAKINYDKNPADCSKLGFPTAPCYLLENLSSVYTYSDRRTYPLSSYSYEIMPTAPTCSGSATQCDPTMNTAKRQTLADFDDFALCTGQSQMAPIGYSPLPINLVEASFQQVKLLHSTDPGVVVSQLSPAHCDNPTFIPGKPSENYLAQIAPYPPACAKAGQGPCPGQYAHNGNPVDGQAAGGSGGSGSGSGGSGSGSGGSGGGGGGSGGSGGSGSGGGSGGGGGKAGGSGGGNSGGSGGGGGGSGGSGGSGSGGGSGGGGAQGSGGGGATGQGTGGASSVGAGGGGSGGSGSGSTQSGSGTSSQGAGSSGQLGVVLQAEPTVLAGDDPGGIGYVGLGALVTALLVVGLFVPALLRGRRRLERRSGR